MTWSPSRLGALTLALSALAAQACGLFFDDVESGTGGGTGGQSPCPFRSGSDEDWLATWQGASITDLVRAPDGRLVVVGVAHPVGEGGLMPDITENRFFVAHIPEEFWIAAWSWTRSG